ncbi:MAG: hypothetical protein ABJP34_00185 [Erythrobacter sp.]
MRATTLFLPLILPLLTLAACKPPATDEATTGRTFGTGPDAPPAPLDSPDSEGAFWANSEDANMSKGGRIIYGQGGKAPLMAMQCLGKGMAAQLQITRLSPADEGGKAFFALVGNSHVLRVPVDATEVTGGFVWQGQIFADHPEMAALTGPAEITATLPGAGMVTLNPSERMKALVSECVARTTPEPALDVLEAGTRSTNLNKS